MDNISKRPKRPNGAGGLSWDKRRSRWVASWIEQTLDGPKHRAVYGVTADVAEHKMRMARGEPFLKDIINQEGDTVYFVQATTGGPIKIGVSGDPEKRLTALQMCCPVPLRLLHAIPGGGYELEKKLHKRFALYRLHGEWFENTAELLGVINDLRIEFKKNGWPRRSK